MTVDLIVLFLLLVANGVFAMAEIALVASRAVRLEQRVAEGHLGAAHALKLKSNSTDFLSTVQVGITLIGILAGAYSGSRLAEPLAEALRPWPIVGPSADGVAFAIVVSGLTFFSLVIGELVPKAIALRDPESIASRIAHAFSVLARLAAPLVRLLSAATSAVLWLLRIRPGQEPHPTQEEIRALIKQATHTGELGQAEQQLVERVFHLDDRRVSSIMTPRHEIDWIDIDTTPELIAQQLAEYGHARILVCQGELDQIVGFCKAEAVLGEVVRGRPLDLRAIIRLPLFVPETVSVLTMLDRFRQAQVHTAIVVDEYGVVQGLVTITDVLENLWGTPPAKPSEGTDAIVPRGDGSWLVDGAVSLDDLRAIVPLPSLDDEEASQFHTIAGLMMTRLSRVPKVGDHVEWEHVRLEVVDMDGRRVDKVLVSTVNPPPADFT